MINSKAYALKKTDLPYEISGLMKVIIGHYPVYTEIRKCQNKNYKRY
jgi:hypothetical protein